MTRVTRAAAGAITLAAAAFAAPSALPAGAPPPPREAGAAAPGAGAQARRVRERIQLGRSVRGRSISVGRLGRPDAERKVLVVGSVHGDEPAGRVLARELERGPLPRNTELWVLRDLNPDGRAARTRTNARGVDLNRNFPFGWRPLPRGRYHSGSRPLSEPESRIAHRLIRQLRPDLTLWFHQPYGFVVESGGDPRVDRRVARLLDLPVRRLPRYPGSITRWQNRTYRDNTAIVVELGPGALTRRRAEWLARRVRTLAP